MTVSHFTRGLPARGSEILAAVIAEQMKCINYGDLDILRPLAQTNANMTIKVAAAFMYSYWYPVLFDDGRVAEFAGGNTTTFIKPSAHPRIDLVCLSSGDILEVVTGVEAASPVVPAVPVGSIPICEVYLPTSATKIVNNENHGTYPNDAYLYKDRRPWICGNSSSPISYSLQYVGLTNYFGGSGSDGNLTVGSDLNIAPNIIKEYNNLTIDAGVTLSLNASGAMLLCVKGNLTVNGTISVTGKGGPGGIAVASGNSPGGAYAAFLGGGGGSGGSLAGQSSGSGGAGGVGNTVVQATPSGDSGFSLGGTGGLGYSSAGGDGRPGAAALSRYTSAGYRYPKIASIQMLLYGGGGGAGGYAQYMSTIYINTGGNGGKGGGAIIIEVFGNIIIGASGIIVANGENGGAGQIGPGNRQWMGSGGGGGGAGGNIFIVHKGTFTNAGTIQANAGSGGVGGDAPPSYVDGGAGGAGAVGCTEVFQIG